MIPPEEFGAYYATGTQKLSRGRAMFFELPDDFQSDYFPLAGIEKRCVPHSDGQPRRSTYLSVYRVLEHVPREALGTLFLVTADGRVLGLESGEPSESESREHRRDGHSLHLYQEMCPLQPQVVSSLGPREFGRRLTDRKQPVSVDRIVFCELCLNGLAEDPQRGMADNLPYSHIAHLRECLITVRDHREKPFKSVVRSMPDDFLYRTVKGGFYVADGTGLSYYPMPDMEKLEREHYEWWRSAIS